MLSDSLSILRQGDDFQKILEGQYNALLGEDIRMIVDAVNIALAEYNRQRSKPYAAKPSILPHYNDLNYGIGITQLRSSLEEMSKKLLSFIPSASLKTFGKTFLDPIGVGIQEGIVTSLKDKIDVQLTKIEGLLGASSALVEGKDNIFLPSATPIPANLGGIDLTHFNTLYQPMGSFIGRNYTLPTLSSSALERIDLGKELASLHQMSSSGIVPSGQRIKEYEAALFQKGRFEEKQDDLLVCLAEIYRLAEEEVLETSPELRESLVIADTGRFVLLPNNQKAGLN